jgi:hypothetical protein
MIFFLGNLQCFSSTRYGTSYGTYYKTGLPPFNCWDLSKARFASISKPTATAPRATIVPTVASTGSVIITTRTPAAAQRNPTPPPK